MSSKPEWTGPAPDADAFYALAEAALANIPAPFQPHIAGLLIEIVDVADAETLDALDIEHPYDLTGLYQGRPLTERMDASSAPPTDAVPDRVTLYRLPILIEWAETGERLDTLVRHVLIHEIGHHFGFSDEDVERIEAMGDPA